MPTPKPRVLLIDGSNISYIARFSKYRTDDELPESPQGWMELIAERIHWLMARLGGWAFIFVMDDPPYQRTAIYPAYKGERDEDTERGRAQWKFIQQRAREFLPTAHQKNYEADDLIARYAERYGNSPEYDVVICSADKDVVQLLGRWNNLSIWRTYKGEWARKPDYDQMVFLALIGDDSDNISGVTGEKTAIKVMQDPEALETLLAKEYKPKARDVRAHEAGLLKELPRTNREVFQRNLRLVALLGPHVILPYCPLDPFPRQPTDLSAVLSGFLGRPWSPPEDQYIEPAPEEDEPGPPVFPTANPFAQAR